MDTTTTTSAPRAFWCGHEQFTSKVDVKRHGQISNGVEQFTYVAELEIWCRQCGCRMVFPCPEGHNHEVKPVPMIPVQAGMETIR